MIRIRYAALAVILLVCLAGPAGAAPAAPAVTQYALPGSPLYLAAESPGRIWFTLPAQNQIGRLVVPASGAPEISVWNVPTPDAEPYDIDYASGIVWFTEHKAGKIGRFDPATGVFTEYGLGRAAQPIAADHTIYLPLVFGRPGQSGTGWQPAGIDVLPGNPVQVWFAEQNANRLGRLQCSGTACTYTAYPLPTVMGEGRPTGVYVQSTDEVWFTAPGASRIGRLRPALYPASNAFTLVGTGPGSQPWNIKISRDGYPWFTDRTGNRIGQFFPTTLQDINWYALPEPASDPYDLDFAGGLVWFSAQAVHQAGQIQSLLIPIEPFTLPGQNPAGLIVDTSGTKWVAESGSNTIARWN